MSEEGPSRCFGSVQTYDQKPKRRLLKGQGMQMNQRVMFFSDGGSDVREVQQYLNTEAEHYLDWFHLTMQITVMGQHAKGLDTTPEKRDEGLLESLKHYLWHGNVARARDKLEDLHDLLAVNQIVSKRFVKKQQMQCYRPLQYINFASCSAV
jgi:hypothetical protein